MSINEATLMRMRSIESNLDQCKKNIACLAKYGFLQNKMGVSAEVCLNFGEAMATLYER